jgi:hypothetical protein
VERGGEEEEESEGITQHNELEMGDKKENAFSPRMRKAPGSNNAAVVELSSMNNSLLNVASDKEGEDAEKDV